MISPELSLRPLAALVGHAAVLMDLSVDDLEILTLATVELAESCRSPRHPLRATVTADNDGVRVSVLATHARTAVDPAEAPLVAVGFSTVGRTERDGELWLTATTTTTGSDR